jgi:2-keto-4-pentenoate hydratase
MTAPSSSTDSTGFDPGLIASQFVHARLEASSLPAYPGIVPNTLALAYAVQDAAISLWPDTVGGWKVGRIPEPWLSHLGMDRLVGPIFSRGIRHAGAGDVMEITAIEGGFTAVESEFIVRVAADAPPGKTQWTVDEARAMVGDLHAGIELAGSPLATINGLGPAVIVSDFGNNSGLIVGPPVRDWARLEQEQLATETFIDGVSVARGTAASNPGGPFEAFAFALGFCAQRGWPLKAGQFVTTGATTGAHEMIVGRVARILYGGIGEISCRAVPARRG